MFAEQEKYDHSIKVLQLAAEMSEKYFQKPLIVCYSGGKDSDVLLRLALESGIKFEVQNSHTTVDAPPTVYHIREVFKELESKGIKCTIRHPAYKNGQWKTMWNLIKKKKYPPTRISRYCCSELKETGTKNRFAALGVREAESVRRRGRSDFSTRSKSQKESEYRTLDQATVVFEQDDDNCKFIQEAKKNKDMICNPIYHWTDDDVWNFIEDRGIKYNPLYNMGFKRVGCVGCPLASKEERELEFTLFPQYKANYIKAFDLMDKSDRDEGTVLSNSGEEIFLWWMQDPRFYGQTELDGWRDIPSGEGKKAVWWEVSTDPTDLRMRCSNCEQISVPTQDMTHCPICGAEIINDIRLPQW